MSFTHLVRLEQISNPANFVESRTNKPTNRSTRLYQNYKAANGLISCHYDFDRFSTFCGVPENDIRIITLAIVHVKTF